MESGAQFFELAGQASEVALAYLRILAMESACWFRAVWMW